MGKHMFLHVLTHFTCVFTGFKTFLANKSEMALGKAKTQKFSWIQLEFSWNSVGIQLGKLVFLQVLTHFRNNQGPQSCKNKPQFQFSWIQLEFSWNSVGKTHAFIGFNTFYLCFCRFYMDFLQISLRWPWGKQKHVFLLIFITFHAKMHERGMGDGKKRLH